MNNPRIDGRTKNDILDRIDALRVSYTPEWVLDKSTTNPDVGSVIAHVYADNVCENIKLLNGTMDRFHGEFINLLDLTLKSVKPAVSIVTMTSAAADGEGVPVAKGTVLSADVIGSEDSEPVLFETDRSLCVTSAAVKDIFLTDKKDGNVYPVLGDFKKQELLKPETPDFGEGDENVLISSASDDQSAENREKEFKPFRMFDGKDSVSRNAFVVMHKNAFDQTDGVVSLKFEGGSKIVNGITDGSFSVSRYEGGSFVPADSVETTYDPEIVNIGFKGECDKYTVGGEEYSVIAVEANDPINEIMFAKSVGFSSEGGPVVPDAICDSDFELDKDDFLPFDKEIVPSKECYIASDTYFSKAGSRVTLSADISYEENRIDVSQMQIDSELKIIKRKPRLVNRLEFADVYVNEIVLEYFNGMGWKKLECDRFYAYDLAGGEAGHISLSFVCPDEWQAIQAGSTEARMIRMRCVRADNCYMRPATHHYPRIKNLMISYSYEGRFMPCNNISVISGTKKKTVDEMEKTEEGVALFSPSQYMEDALYLGFDKPIGAGPASILFMLKDSVYHETLGLRFEYRSTRGFSRIRVLDLTEGFSKSGIIMFDPPSDFIKSSIEDRERYWIRIVATQKHKILESRKSFLPVVNGIFMNGMTVTNISTGIEEDFYMDESLPGMRFALGTDKLLKIDLWVNEIGAITAEEREYILEHTPEITRAEYDVLGNLSAFYIKWEEAENFLFDKRRRIYCLDRLNNEVVFGDGMNQDIPTVTSDVAFKVKAYRSDGDRGNLPEHSITGKSGNAMFLDAVDNPVKSYGGSAMETVPQALARGADIISSRRRLISKIDYLRLVKGYSEGIDKAEVLSDGDNVVILLLMKDYNDGAFSFHMLSAKLKSYLLEKCELTVAASNIRISEPIFVSLCVSAWLDVDDLEDCFELQEHIAEELEEYIDPVSGGKGEGWRIGIIPKRSQIMMKVNSVRGMASLKKMTVSAIYTDETGEHETDLDSLLIRPDMCVRNAKHHIYVNFEGGEGDNLA